MLSQTGSHSPAFCLPDNTQVLQWQAGIPLRSGIPEKRNKILEKLGEVHPPDDGTIFVLGTNLLLHAYVKKQAVIDEVAKREADKKSEDSAK